MKIEDTKNITTKQLMELIEAPERTFYRLKKLGVFTPVKRGRFNLRESLHSYHEHLQNHNELSESKKRLTDEQYRKLKLDNDEKEGELLPEQDVQIIFNETMHIIKTHADSLPGRVANELSAITNAGVIRQKLQHEIRQMLTAMANKLSEMADLGRQGK